MKRVFYCVIATSDEPDIRHWLYEIATFRQNLVKLHACFIAKYLLIFSDIHSGKLSRFLNYKLIEHISFEGHREPFQAGSPRPL